MKPKKSQTLLALGTAASIAVYAAGFARTEAAAKRMAEFDRGRPPPDDTREPRIIREKDAQVAASVSEPVPSTAITTAAAQAVAQQVVFSTEKPIPVVQPGPVKLVYTSQGIGVPSDSGGPVRLLAKYLPNPAAGARAEKDFLAELPAPIAKWKDGRWFGWGYCRHGNLKVEVEIVGGQITECVISECYTNYDVGSVRNLTGQVVTRQSYNIGSMSGATQSSDAFYYALVEALQAAKKAAM